MKNLIFASVLFLFSGALLLTTSFTKPEKKALPARENTPGTVTFTATTQSQGGSYAPKHVLAIWVEHDGEFVKTRKAMANQRKQYLYTWKAASDYNVADATTGPTLNSHQTHTIEWDCTDLDGNVVADGTYVMWIEFTEKHAQGPLFNIEFEKGPEGFDINPPDENYFKNMQLAWEPEVVLVADFTADTEETCIGETVTFTDNSTGATTWEWDFGGDAIPPTASTQGPHEVTYTTAGSKTVSLTIDQGITQTKTGYITVYPDAVAGFTWTQQDRTITFTNTSENADAYSWNFGDGQTSNEENPVHTFEEDGTYNVSLIAIPVMCEEDMYMEEIVINTVGIESPQDGLAFIVYPNPGNGLFRMMSPESLSNVTINIYDVKGNRVFTRDYFRINANAEVSAGNPQLVPGLYFISVESAGKTFRDKLLVK